MKPARAWLLLCTLTALTAFAQPEKDEDPDFATPDDAVERADAGADALNGAPAAVVDAADDDERAGARGRVGDLSEGQAIAVGLGSLCCCLSFVVGIGALILWGVRRSRRAAPAQ